MTSEHSKTVLLTEIKHSKWRKSIDEQDYKNTCDLVQQIRKNNLDEVSQANRSFKQTKYVKKSVLCRKVSGDARKAYYSWRKQNASKKQCPEVSVQNLLCLIHYLNAEPDKKHKKDIHECLKRQNSEFEIFWDAPSYILQALRKCVTTRDWSNMTHLLLILLNYDNKYLHIIKNMCRIMVKFNPLIQECGLEDQFSTFLDKCEEDLVVV